MSGGGRVLAEDRGEGSRGLMTSPLWGCEKEEREEKGKRCNRNGAERRDRGNRYRELHQVLAVSVSICYTWNVCMCFSLGKSP